MARDGTLRGGRRIRAGYGWDELQEDVLFEEHYVRAKTAGLHVGAYWYSYARSVDHAILEARVCQKILAGKQFEYPIYFDLEEKFQLARGRDFCNSLVTAFCTEMEKAGYFAGFYTSATVARNILSPSIRKRFAFWCAQWSDENSFDGESGLWQYTSRGTVSGIQDRVDRNISYVDYPSIIQKGGFNGYGKKTIMQMKRKSVEELACEVLKGRWGNGQERKDRLRKTGYDYEAVQERVNEKLDRPKKKSLDVIAREVVRGDWGNGEERKRRLRAAGYDYVKVQEKVNMLI